MNKKEKLEELFKEEKKKFKRGESDLSLEEILKAEDLSYKAADRIKTFKQKLKEFKAIKKTPVEKIQEIFKERANERVPLNILKKAKVHILNKKKTELKEIEVNLVNNIQNIANLGESD